MFWNKWLSLLYKLIIFITFNIMWYDLNLNVIKLTNTAFQRTVEWLNSNFRCLDFRNFRIFETEVSKIYEFLTNNSQYLNVLRPF